MSLNILFLGPAYGTCQHRADALRRLGHTVHHIDPHTFLPRKGFAGRVVGKLIYELGGGVFEPFVRRRLLAVLPQGRRFDLAWVNGGEFFGLSTIAALRVTAPIILNYNNDDPFGKRDKRRFAAYRSAVKEYDLLVVCREVNVGEAIDSQAKSVLLVCMSADEVAHAPLTLVQSEMEKWRSEVVFVGTWMPERGPFMARLLELGVPLRIFGDRWHKAPEWQCIRQAWAGPNLAGADYVKAIQCAKLNLGLLSKGNRDLHTTRSAEIPYVGSVLCAERTMEHEAMYRENEEAVFWSTPEECAEKCFWLLENPAIRERIAQAGRERCIANDMLNEAVLRKILGAALARGS